MISRKRTIVIGVIAVLLVPLLTALGCKKNETPATTNVNTTGDVGNALSNLNFEPLTNLDLGNEVTNVNAVVSNENAAPTNTAVNTNEAANTNAAPTNDNSAGQGNEAAANENTNSSGEATDVLALTKRLAEIFGTFTNRDGYKNFKDLQNYVTPEMQNWLNAQMQKTQNASAPFYGVTTKVLSQATLAESASDMQILATARREEISSASKTPRSSYELLLMNLKKSGDEWKLMSAYWQ